MPKLFTIESHESHKPTLLLYGGKNEILDTLITTYKEEFNVLVLSPEVEQTGLQETVYYVSKESYYLLDRLVNSIDYAVVFLDHHTKTIIQTIHEKLHKDNTKVVYVLERDKWEHPELFVPTVRGIQASVIFLGEIISHTIHKNSSDIAKFVFQALLQKKAYLEGNDLLPIFPIGIDDAIRGINHCIFGQTHTNTCYFLFYSHPQTYISATHVLKRVEPDLEIKMSDTEPSIQKESPLAIAARFIQKTFETRPILLEKYFEGFEKTAQHIADKLPHSPIPKEVFSRFTVERMQKRKRATSFVSFWTKSIFWGMIGFIILQAIFLCLAWVNATKAAHLFTNGNYSAGIELVKKSESYLQVSDPLVTALEPVAQIFDHTNKIQTSIDTLHIVAGLAESTQGIVHTTNGLPHVDTHKLDDFVSTILSFYSALQAHQAEGHTLIDVAHQPIGIAKSIDVLPILATLLGQNSDKNYLLLFQNNGELRPTGGFIGSIGELGIKNGQFSDLAIDDVYNIDGQLKTPIEPYYIIRRYLEPHLFLRDSNFDLNFEYSASTAAMLYNMSVHKRVDGVVAIDFETIKRIIEAVGPVSLTTYHITLTPENTFQFLQNTIQSNAFAGSQEKKNILTDLKNALIVKVSEQPELYSKIAALIPGLLTEKHIMAAFQDKAIENIFSAEGLSGNYVDPRNTQNILPDVLSVNEANIGANKANVSVTHQVEYYTSLDVGKNMLSHVKLTIHNAGHDAYKSYVRILTPLGSTITHISINGENQSIIPAITDPKVYEAKGFKTPKGLEVDNSDDYGYHFFGFVTSVTANSSQVIEVEYTNGISIPATTAYNYSLLYFKQPGTDNYSLSVTLHHDPTYVAHTSEGVAGTDTTSFQRIADQDQEIRVQFIQK